MEKKLFQEGMGRFKKCFPGLDFEPETLKVWFSLLRHLEDYKFKKAVDIVCGANTDIYPSTNIAALILAADKADWRNS